MGLKSLSVKIVLLFVILAEISAQGERCYTPDDSYGFCVVLPQCPSLVNYYGQNQNNRYVINYLLAAQRNCGTRSIRRNPLVCCSDPVFNRPNEIRPQPRPQPQPQPQPFPEQPEEIPPEIVQTTPKPIPQTTPPTAPTTLAPIIDQSTRSSEITCNDPNGLEGVCKNIKECPSILSEFIAKSKDMAYVRYIRQSSANCRNMQPFVCCPYEGRSTPPSEPIVDHSLEGRLLTVDEGCGFSNVTHRRIVGGNAAKPGAFPWMANLGYKNNLGEISWKCGGSLITTRHVLSAAHCILNSLSTVRLGEHDISSTTDGPVQDIPVTRSVRHPNYNRKDGTNDISVLYLEHDADLSLRVRTICLPVDQEIRARSFVGYQPFVAGWGRLQEGGKSSNVLQELQLPILDNSECKEQYRKQGKLISEVQFGDAVVCAGVLSGGQDSCQGDSGGPLMQPIYDENSGSRYYQIGVVSYGIGCARTNTPGVYSNVAHFMDWIQERINE